MGQHTPGPWKWEGVALVAPNGHAILWPYNIPNSVTNEDPMSLRMGCGHSDTSEAAEANARLIVAAPDLLAACDIRELDPMMHHGPNADVSDSYPVELTLTMGELRAIAAAIAKARPAPGAPSA